MKIRIVQDLQCPKCGNKLKMEGISIWEEKPYCDMCNTSWEIIVMAEKEFIRIEYKEK